ncbi:MAG: hypothetical protein ACOCP4_03680 [Candidatus Woesearchaeota archaeon]
MAERLWEFKYMPTKWEDLIINDELKETLRKNLDERPNMLLYGPPGCGKGSYIDVLINHNEIKGCTLKINASLEGGIDTIRDKVRSFAQAANFELGKLKLVHLNECLEENEEILLSDGSCEKMKNLLDNNIQLKSFNLETNTIENDEADIISDKIDDCYEVEFEDGTKILMNEEHPLIIKRKGKNIEVKLKDINDSDEVLSVFE